MLPCPSHFFLLCLAVACTGKDRPDASDDDDDSTDPEPAPADTRYEGDDPDAGLGTAVALGAAGAWASAPFGTLSKIHALPSAGPAEVIFESSDRAGLTLATDHGGSLLIGAPMLGDGAVLAADGSVLFEGGGVGRGVAAGPIALDATGWTDGADGGVRTPTRPTSIAVRSGVVAVGMAEGDASALLGDVSVTRQHPSEGFAIAGGDLDGDGTPEWAIGAPQADIVRVVSASGETVAELRGTGRFGAALAMADMDGDGRSELLIGAPRANNDSGEVFLYDSQLEVSQTFAGASGDRLGTAVAMAVNGLLLGAPGGPGQPGAVLWIAP